MAESHTDAVLESTPDDPKASLLTLSDVADQWKVSLRTVQRYVADGRLKAIKLPGGYYRVRPEDAEAAITEASA